MANVVPNLDHVRDRILRARELMETRELLEELLRLPEARLLPMFGITRWGPQEVHHYKDMIFLGVITELVTNGWNCNAASFGDGHRDTFLMEMVRRGYFQSVTRLLEMGADSDHNTQGYGASTVLMCARDPEIMKKLLYYGANPLATNACGQTDFTYKLFKGLTPGARFYLYNTEKIPFQSLLANYKDCVVSRTCVPYEPMYPLCLVPVVPEGGPYPNVIDRVLVDNMLREHYMPFSSKALKYSIDETTTVWQYIKRSLRLSSVAVPALVIALMACMTKLEECRTLEDFAFIESYIEKPLPRELRTRENFSKAVFVYMLFTLSMLPASHILRWLVLLDKLIRKMSMWMDALGDTPFKVVNSLMASEKKDSHVLHELMTMQALLAMRVNVTDSFGEFRIPEELTNLLSSGDSIAD